MIKLQINYIYIYIYKSERLVDTKRSDFLFLTIVLYLLFLFNGLSLFLIRYQSLVVHSRSYPAPHT